MSRSVKKEEEEDEDDEEGGYSAMDRRASHLPRWSLNGAKAVVYSMQPCSPCGPVVM